MSSTKTKGQAKQPPKEEFDADLSDDTQNEEVKAETKIVKRKDTKKKKSSKKVSDKRKDTNPEKKNEDGVGEGIVVQEKTVGD